MALSSKQKLVIANRGEIARRVMRTARRMGYEVAVISTPSDLLQLVRFEADAVLEVPSFLDAKAVIAAAQSWGGAGAFVHPGYGFLSENADFAAGVEAAGLVFVGPTPANMRQLGAKEPAKELARASGVPTLEVLSSGELKSVPSGKWAALLEEKGIRSPFLVKASGGGGGRGMRVVDEAARLPDAVERAAQEALASFGDGTVFLERYLSNVRHVEIQVLGDGQGGGVALAERECSLQRRHQKVLEEAPSPSLDSAARQRLGSLALRMVQHTRYRGAGTLEFLYLDSGEAFFLELNARLQVEHPVTELVTGIDLVEAQLLVASGAWPASLPPAAALTVLEPRGWAVEARVLAEDPRRDFLPTPGPVLAYEEPQGLGVRVDSGIRAGSEVNPAYDSMIAKVIGYGATRQEALDRLAKALAGLRVEGCITNLAFLGALCAHPAVRAAQMHTRWIESHLAELNAMSAVPQELMDLFEAPALQRELLDAARAQGNALPACATKTALTAAFNAVALSASAALAGSQRGARIVRGASPGLAWLHGPEVDGLLARFAAAGAWDALAPPLHGPLWGRVHSGQHGVSVEGNPASAGLALRVADVGSGRVWVDLAGHQWIVDCAAAGADAGENAGASDRELRAPLAGKVLEVRVSAGEAVEAGQVLFILESMKMQLEVRSRRKGVIAAVAVKPGALLSGTDILATFAGEPA